MTQLDVVCDLGISFNVASSWMSWTLDIEIDLAILAESDFSWTWYQCHWKSHVILCPYICRRSKFDFVCILYIYLKLRLSWTPSWTQSQTREFRIGLDVHHDVHISLPLQHPLDVPFILLIIFMVPNNN
jgi:hypothetical protein